MADQEAEGWRFFPDFCDRERNPTDNGRYPQQTPFYYDRGQRTVEKVPPGRRFRRSYIDDPGTYRSIRIARR